MYRLNFLLKPRWLVSTLVVALLATPALALATTLNFQTTLTPLNDSGVTGMAYLTLDGNLLTVQINASGLEPNQPHAQHIHGTFDASGNPTDATTPTMAQDTNGDGLIEVTEGAATYGPILVPLTPFPVAPDGTVNFTQTYNLDGDIYFDSPALGRTATKSDLFPLPFREIVLHGMNTPVDIVNGGLDGQTFFAMGSYVGTLPIASGEIMAVTSVPEPSSMYDMLAGLGIVFVLVGLGRREWRRRKMD